MDLSKKRKSETLTAAVASPPQPRPSAAVISAVLESLTKPQLIEITAAAAADNASVLAAVRSATSSADATRCKLFVRGLGPETSSEMLNLAFSAFGEVEEAVAVADKATGKPRGYGFVVYRYIDGAITALESPSKKIDGRMTVAQLAAAKNNANADVAARKVYVGNIPSDVSADRLLALFMSYGEVEEGPLGFDNQSGKPKRFAFFIYKTEEGARASLVDPIKTMDGHQIVCKLAVDGKKGKHGPNEGDFGNGPNLVPGFMNSSQMTHNKPFFDSGMGPRGGGPGFQSPPMFDGGYGPGGYVNSQFRGPGVPGLSEFGPGGLSNGGSLYRPGYSEGGNYGPGYPSQMNQPLSGPRGPPPGGMYPGLPPYY